MKPTLLLSTMLCFFTSTLTFSQTPANDTPAGATALTVGVGSCSGNTAGGDLTNASNSNVGGTPSCGSVLISDVWYTAVVPASGNLAIETFNVSGSSFQSVLTAYTKDSSDVYTAVGCDDNSGTGTLSKLILSDQTAGTTVYIRVWGYGGDRDPFELCAWDPTVPANDTPAGATALTVGAGSCSGNTAGGDLTNASNSNVGGTPSCGSGISSDVWYTAVVPTSGNLTIETFNVGGSSFDSVLTAYTKDSSDVYTAVGCDDRGGTTNNPSKLILSDQTAGTTVYIRVWGYSGDRDPFELCAWDPTVPANDTPAGATALTVGAGSCSGNTAGGDLTNASNSNVGGTPSCGSGISSDVWYTAVVPTSGNLTIETFNVGGSSFDSVLTAYTKDSSDVYTAVGCNDDGGTGALSKLILSDQPAGTTVYIRVWGYSGDRKPFELCAWAPVPLSTLELDEIVVRVYPIPTKNTLKIDTSLSLKSARVYSLTGKQLLSSALDQLTIDVSSLPSGIYLLQITHNRGNTHVKFIKE